jgi:site-specific recombinase XerD
MGIAGGCRVGELVNMKIDDVDDRGNVLVVTLPDTKTNKPRMFTIIIEVAINAVDIYRKYVILRPQVVAYRRFFLNYQRTQM